MLIKFEFIIFDLLALDKANFENYKNCGVFVIQNFG